MKKLTPRAVAPFFILCALVHLLSIFSRFDLVTVRLAEHLPAGFSGGLLVATFALLLLEGYFEGRVDYGDSSVDLPTWMTINSKPVKLAFTFAFTYLAIVLLQTLDLEIGPIDPTPPEDWDAPKRFQFFAMMSVGMFFPNYLAASGLLIPGLRTITSPLRSLPTLMAVLIALVAGIAIGFGVSVGVESQAVGDGVAFMNTIQENPMVVVGTTIVTTLLTLVGTLFGSDDAEDSD